MKFTWPESARSELRAIDRESAIRIRLSGLGIGRMFTADPR